MPAGTDKYLQPSTIVDSDNPAIVSLVKSLVNPAASALENALTLYYWVRDEIRYNPYGLQLDEQGLAASNVLRQGQAWCVPKANLLAAMCRCAGIPARLGYADVRNHLSTERMRQTMETDLFYFHGYTSIYLNGRWVKATPAFNIELCDKFGLKPLEFNGLEDSLYHEFDQAGNKHMEYVRDRGEYADVPLAEMLAVFMQHYPAMMAQSGVLQDAAQWDADVAAEVQA